MPRASAEYEVRVRADVARGRRGTRSSRGARLRTRVDDPPVPDVDVARVDARRDRGTSTTGGAAEDHLCRLLVAACWRGAARRRAPPASPSSAAASGGCRRRRGARRRPPTPWARARSRRRPSRRTGPSGCGSSTKMHSTGGIPVGGMMFSDFSVSVVRARRPPRRTPRRAPGRGPCAPPPSIWPSSERRVDRLPDVVGGDDLLDPALVVEDRRPASPTRTRSAWRPPSGPVPGLCVQSACGPRRRTPGPRGPRSRRPFSAAFRLGGRVDHRRGRRARSRATPWSGPSSSSRSVSTTTRTRSRRQPELLAGDLLQDRVARPAPSRSRSGRASRCRRPPARRTALPHSARPLPMPVFFDAAGDADVASPSVGVPHGPEPGSS